MNVKPARVVGWWLSICSKRPWTILLICAAALAATIPVTLGLRIDTDLAKLLPGDLPEVREMETLKEKIGDLGYFSIVVEGDDQAELVRFAGIMKEELEKSLWVRTVVYRNPVDFIKRTKYLWIPTDQLVRIGDYLEKKHCEKNPFCVSLDDDEEEGGKDRAGSEDVRLILERYKTKIQSFESMPRYHLSPDGRILAMRVRPGRGLTNVDQVRRMLGDLESRLGSVRQEHGFSSIAMMLVGGSLRSRLDEYEIVLGDVARGGWVGGLLIVAMLVLAFRNPWTVMLSLVPLLAGMGATLFITAAAIGYLNTITALLFAVIFGIGIDVGIHLAARTVSLVSSGRTPRQALAATLTTTGRAVVVASLTTALGFFIMTVSDFKGFAHLGFIAGVGILCIALSYLVLFPVLVLLAARRSIRLGPYLALKSIRRRRMFSGRRGAPAIVISLALLTAGGLSLPFVAFNYDFDSLSGSNEDLRLVRDKQAKVYTESLTPGGVVFAPDEAAARSILSLYRDRMKQPGSVIDRVLSITTFIPADQERRLKELERIGTYLTPGLLRTVEDPEVRRELEQMKQAGGLRPLAPSDLPLSVREMFVLQDGGAAFPVYLYGRERMTNGEAAMRFQSQVGSVSIAGRKYVATGGALIYASVLRRVVKQGPWIFLASLFFIIVVVAVQFKKLVKGVLALLPLLTGLALMVMIMAAADIDLNMYNVAILAAIVGLGVDYGIHFYAYYADLPGSASRPERASRTLHDLFRPLLFSWLTTSAGYAGLVISHHPGLRSIGVLALTGLTCCFVMSVTLLPMLLSAVIRRKRKSSPIDLLIKKTPNTVPHRAVSSFSTANGTLLSSDMISLR